MKILAILQNAWSPVYAGGVWPRESWLKALRRSRSGRRLRVFETYAHGAEIYFDNTTPIVGATPDSILPADLAHVRAIAGSFRPDLVVTFGRHAAAAVDAAALPFRRLAVPHPAHRLVTNRLYAAAGKLAISGRIVNAAEIRQLRGRISTEFYNHDALTS